MPSHVAPGANALNVYIIQPDSDAAIAWYSKYLGAKEVFRLAIPGGGVMHAEVEIEGNLLMMSDANAEWGTAAPGELSTMTLTLYVEDCSVVFDRCVAGGATALEPVTDQFWGDRAGKIRDPFGHIWMIMTHVEEVPHDEVRKRFEAMMSGG